MTSVKNHAIALCSIITSNQVLCVPLLKAAAILKAEFGAERLIAQVQMTDLSSLSIIRAILRHTHTPTAVGTNCKKNAFIFVDYKILV